MIICFLNVISLRRHLVAVRHLPVLLLASGRCCFFQPNRPGLSGLNLFLSVRFFASLQPWALFLLATAACSPRLPVQAPNCPFHFSFSLSGSLLPHLQSIFPRLHFHSLLFLSPLLFSYQSCCGLGRCAITLVVEEVSTPSDSFPFRFFVR